MLLATVAIRTSQTKRRFCKKKPAPMREPVGLICGGGAACSLSGYGVGAR